MFGKVHIEERVPVPENVEVSLEGSVVRVRGPKRRDPPITYNFEFPGIVLSMEDKSIVIRSFSKRRKHRAMVGTIKALLRNAFKGVTEGWEVKMKIVYSHFPITVEVRKDEKKVYIHNFLGEKCPREAEIVGDVEITVKGDELIIRGADKYEVGQTACNIERATKIKRRDPRVFQDGIYRVVE